MHNEYFMRTRFIISSLLLHIHLLNAQPTLLKEQVIKSAQFYQQKGLVKFSSAQFTSLKESPSRYDTSWKSSDYFQFAIRLAYSLSIGTPVKPLFAYESIAAEQINVVYQRLIAALGQVKTADELRGYFESYRLPRSTKTKMLSSSILSKEREYAKRPSRLLADTIRWLKHAYGFYHWLDHWGFSRFILVDIAAAEVQLVEGERVLFSMRAVVGKSSTPTPSFAAWAERIVLYPYWFVPSSIAIGEFLPKIKNDPTWLDRQNMQVIDGRGNIVDPKDLNWHEFNAAYFPYTIRQSTGCDNALGILKIDVKTPFGVYLHDTNNKSSFLLSKRFLSHGCIRLEEPLLLGNQLLDKPLDTLYLQACLKEQQPVYLSLKVPIPVIAFYTLAHPQQEGGVRYFRDTYQQFQKK